MTCAEIEELILDGGELGLVESHARQCPDCLSFWEAAREIDFALASIPKAPARLSRAVIAAVAPKPSYVPELLDFVGWAAMVAVTIEVVTRLLAT